MLRIYNSLNNRKEAFEPIEANRIRLYVCGITVYDFCHLGHARSMVVFDMIVRYLRALDYQVTFVRNITDIDDKIIRRALENGESVSDLTRRFIDLMHEDEQALNVLPPDIEPRATQCMPAILAMIQRLFDAQYAYHVTNGDVYFDVRKFSLYGRLAGRDLDKERSGGRVELDTQKHDPLDFVLWKRSKPDEPHWASPWGQGRPGWHIECSAMSTHYLGEHFDIHGGGVDLKFPHHENEIAQAQTATGKTFANYWLHNGMITVDGKKMSKSAGNYHTIRDILASHRAEAVRYFFLTSQYASPLDYSHAALVNAGESLDRLYTALRGLDLNAAENGTAAASFKDRFQQAMSDDFNTPGALSVLFDWVREINRARQADDGLLAAQLGKTLRKTAGILGLLQADPEIYFRGQTTANEKRIEALIAERESAREAKAFGRADAIRSRLKDMGVILEDAATGTKWKRIR